jgi:hypothetical protein
MALPADCFTLQTYSGKVSPSETAACRGKNVLI